MARQMPKFVYVSSYSGDEARKLVAELRKAGHVVVSTWHDEDNQRKDWSTTGAAEEGKRQGAAVNLRIIGERANVFVVQADGQKHPGGKHVELGFAIACREWTQLAEVYLIGTPENGMQYHPDVTHLPDTAALLEKLATGVDADDDS